MGTLLGMKWGKTTRSKFINFANTWFVTQGEKALEQDQDIKARVVDAEEKQCVNGAVSQSEGKGPPPAASIWPKPQVYFLTWEVFDCQRSEQGLWNGVSKWAGSSSGFHP